MTGRLRITGKDLLKILEKEGFKVIRVRGSHHFLRHSDGRRTVVPVHAGETLGPGLVARILRDCELDRKQLMGLL